ncbi:hypothetical protein [Lactiplantibacillus paraplantarum]|uniref:hypothetical protein n=1 Tax=Lactiplantibacillus paraplantarum TaxID=60520 RepID=UPI003DA556B6
MIDKIVSIFCSQIVPFINEIINGWHKKHKCKRAINGATSTQRYILNELQQGRRKYKDSREGIDFLLRNSVISRGTPVFSPNYVGNDFREDVNDPAHWYSLTEYAEKYLQNK